ncbi:Coproporphyrinogen-III oxidase [Tulasnella sp. 403]|nr:Coproporphyrinogen-III oxidase [Tulasnella sp. 403]
MASSHTPPMRDQMTEYIKALQIQIVSALESLDQTNTFLHDSWTREQGGYGISCVTSNGKVLEKAGVNISVVHGDLPPAAVQQMRVNHKEIPEMNMQGGNIPFFACGISLVIHPRNPMAPTVHANYRYFEISKERGSTETDPDVISWWFGGGADLTPSYLYEDDAAHFHTTLRDACHGYLPEEVRSDSIKLASTGLYFPLKKWCDEYFVISHRGESRGLGGIFFDDLNASPHPRFSEAANAARPTTPEGIFKFIQSCGDAFIPSYIPILSRRMNESYTDDNRRWQLLRRGRYVEFNLVYDRGTKFGIQTPGARIESILMSLPETARWEYMSDMGAEGTEEAKIMKYLKNPKDWI